MSDEQPPDNTTIHVAVYWPDEGYGIPAEVANMEEAQAKARAWAGADYNAGRAQIHIIETVRKVHVWPQHAEGGSLMKWLAFAAVAALIASGAAQAAPTFCTGVTDIIANGGAVPASFLLTPGNCVEAGDKVFGLASVSGAITGNGSASFAFSMTPGNVTIGFLGTVGPSSTGTLGYTVAVDPALSQGFLIDDLQKDFTFNANPITGGPASAHLTGITTPASSIVFDCTRTANPDSGTCPQTGFFSPNIAQLAVTETLTTAPNTVVTALTDTISQAVPEPGTLAMLGGSLLMLGFAAHRRRQY
jgi:hypothetical protein